MNERQLRRLIHKYEKLVYKHTNSACNWASQEHGDLARANASAALDAEAQAQRLKLELADLLNLNT